MPDAPAVVQRTRTSYISIMMSTPKNEEGTRGWRLTQIKYPPTSAVYTSLSLISSGRSHGLQGNVRHSINCTHGTHAMNGENGYVAKWILAGTLAAIRVLLLPACRLLLLLLAISLLIIAILQLTCDLHASAHHLHASS